MARNSGLVFSDYQPTPEERQLLQHLGGHMLMPMSDGETRYSLDDMRVIHRLAHQLRPHADHYPYPDQETHDRVLEHLSVEEMLAEVQQMREELE